MLRRNAGPIVQYKNISERLNYKNNIKNQTLKLLDFKQKMSCQKKHVNTCRLNIIYGFSETWFNDSNNNN